MSGFEVVHAIIKVTSTSFKILSSIATCIDEDERSARLTRRAKRKLRAIKNTIAEHRVAVDKCVQLHSIMHKYINDMDSINRELSELCDQVSKKIAPLRVADAVSTSAALDRIVCRIENFETRIDSFCTAAVSMQVQNNAKAELNQMKALIQSMHSLDVSAVDVQAPVVHSDAFHFAPSDTMYVNRTELVFVPKLNLSSKDTKTLHDLGDLGFLPIADSLVEAGATLFHGLKSVNRNMEEGIRFLELASSLKNPESHYYLGWIKEWQGDYIGAAEHAIAGCEMGYFDSGEILVHLYKKGYLDLKKRRKSIKWIKKVAQNGNENGQELAVMRKLVESITKKDREEAFRMAKAAEPTETSRLILGICYFYGFGTRKSEEKARASFPESTDKPTRDFFYHASILYDQSPLILKFMRHFANLDVSVACELLADYFICAAGHYGSYYEEALKWAKKSADLGSIWFQYRYAHLCENGVFCEINMSKAYRYYRMAAKQGDHDCQITIARLYINGAGVGRDLSKAKYYLKLAMNSDSEENRNRAQKLWKIIN